MGAALGGVALVLAALWLWCRVQDRKRRAHRRRRAPMLGAAVPVAGVVRVQQAEGEREEGLPRYEDRRGDVLLNATAPAPAPPQSHAPPDDPPPPAHDYPPEYATHPR